MSWSSNDLSVVTVSPALAIYRVLLAPEIAHLVQANAYVFGGSAEKTIWEIEGGCSRSSSWRTIASGTDPV